MDQARVNLSMRSLTMTYGRNILGTISMCRKYRFIISLVLTILRNLKRRLASLNARLFTSDSSSCLHPLRRRFVLLKLPWLIQHYRRYFEVAHFDAGLALLEPISGVHVFLLLRGGICVTII